MSEATADQTMLEWAEQVPVNITRLDWSEDDLRSAAEGNAVEQRFSYLDRCQSRGDYVDSDSYNLDVPDEDRALVNFLRHHCSNYDALLIELDSWEFVYEGMCHECGEPVSIGECEHCGEEVDDWDERNAFNREKDAAYVTIRRRVHAALSEAYPQFAELLEE